MVQTGVQFAMKSRPQGFQALCYNVQCCAVVPPLGQLGLPRLPEQQKKSINYLSNFMSLWLTVWSAQFLLGDKNTNKKNASKIKRVPASLVLRKSEIKKKKRERFSAQQGHCIVLFNLFFIPKRFFTYKTLVIKLSTTDILRHLPMSNKDGDTCSEILNLINSNNRYSVGLKSRDFTSVQTHIYSPFKEDMVKSSNRVWRAWIKNIIHFLRITVCLHLFKYFS